MDVAGAEGAAVLPSDELAVLRERERWARDLHDSVAQSIYVLCTHAQVLQRALDDGDVELAAGLAADVERVSRRAAEQLRRVVDGARPDEGPEGLLDGLLHDRTRDQVDLVTALRAVAAQVELDSTLRITVEVAAGSPEVSRLVAHELVLVVREALHNVVKHAGTGEARVALSSDGAVVRVEVKDRGCGFEVGARHHGVGLGSMRHRVESCGGTLRVVSSPGVGTCLTLHVPRGLPVPPV